MKSNKSGPGRPVSLIFTVANSSVQLELRMEARDVSAALQVGPSVGFVLDRGLDGLAVAAVHLT